MRIATDKPYNIFAEVVEQQALDQFESAMQQPFVVRGALMPDVHVGYSLPIGAVIATKDVVVPAWVGYDIGCGMCALPTSFSPAEVRAKAKEIFGAIYMSVPVGFAHNQYDTTWHEGSLLPRSAKTAEIFAKNGLKQLGSLGGGNHFIEIGEDQNESVWIIIHSGSRGIGHTVATHYMKSASGDGKAREGHFGFSVASAEGASYIVDLNFCLAFALENRCEIMRRVERVLALRCTGSGKWNLLINRNHNHAELREDIWIHRKGATHAEYQMTGVIPGNMRDGSFIVCGKGNPDSLWSSSHGAGRILGRKAALRTLGVNDFTETMSGIVASVSEDTLDESPSAYKSIYSVMEQQKDLVDVLAYVRPIINVKG